MPGEEKTYGELLQEALGEAVEIKEGRDKPARSSRRRLSARTVEVREPPSFTPTRIRRVRRSLLMSQAVFAGVLNVSKSTVAAWEQGQRTPTGATLRLLELAESEPEILAARLEPAERRRPPRDERRGPQPRHGAIATRSIRFPRSAGLAREQSRSSRCRFSMEVPMTKLQDVIVTDPEIQGGTPVFRGTRVPIRNLLDHLAGGGTLPEFLDDYPSVSREQARAALELAKEALAAGASSP